jgi:4-amino-4-deoxy-L-arabinose transferase-like glycosyltransferase
MGVIPKYPGRLQDQKTWVFSSLLFRSHGLCRSPALFFKNCFLEHIPILAIILLATYLITINVATPWQSMHEDNGTLNESIALSHLHLGLIFTKGQDILAQEARQSFGPLDVTEAQHFAYFASDQVHREPYGHHPPLLGLTIALSFVTFGPHFWSERLVPIVYALVGLILFYFIIARWFDRGIARFAAFLYATFPMFGYFGRNVSHESSVLFYALLILLGYGEWKRTYRKRWLILIAFGTIIGCGYGWPIFYFIPLLYIIDWLCEHYPDRHLALAMMVPMLLSAIIIVAQLCWVLNGSIDQLGTIFTRRIGGGSDEQTIIVTTITWFSQLTSWNTEGFGLWSQIALPASLGYALTKMHTITLPMPARLGAILGVWGISHILLFRNGAFVHAYWQFYLLPAYALFFGWTAVTMARHHISVPFWRTIALTFFGMVACVLGLASLISLYSTGYHTILPIIPLFDIWH